MHLLPNLTRPCRAGPVFLAILAMAMVPAGVRADAPTPAQGNAPAKSGRADDPEGILNMDVDQLAKVNVQAPALNVETTSMARQESTVGRTAGAIYVITQEMIQRSGALNIPDVLRLVPGLDVAQVNSHTWAISSRGFNDEYADKLLVLIDGRIVYSPLFAGTYWDVQDVVLEDIDRIEVIRGPGGTIWGVNAVNGVINIITKKAKDTQGALVNVGGGTDYLDREEFRYGGQIGEDLYFRVYGKAFDHSPGFGDGADWWHQGRTGFRADWEPDKDKSNVFTFQGDYYSGEAGYNSGMDIPVPPFRTTIAGDEGVLGGNLLAHWKHIISDDSDWDLLTYYDRADRNYGVFWDQAVNTFDIEFQHRFPLGPRNEITWGGQYRQIHDDETTFPFALNFEPPSRTTGEFNMYVQNQMTLVPDRLFFTFGSRFDQNDYTGFEYEPSARVLYTPDKKQSWWAAISRAVRIPSRLNANGDITPFAPEPLPYPPPLNQEFFRFEGNSSLLSEDLIAYELGYRAQPDPKFSYDIALFYNVYTQLTALQPSSYYFDQGNLILPFLTVNGGNAQTWGGEISAHYALTDTWRLTANYSLLEWEFQFAPGDIPYVFDLPGSNPHNQVQFISSWDFGRRLQFDMILRYVDSLPGEILYGFPIDGVRNYTTMDLRLAWQANKHLECALIGRNLFDYHHQEFNELMGLYQSQVERSVFGSMTWRY